MRPYCQGGVVHAPERVVSSVAPKGEVGHVPEVGGRNCVQDPEGGTTNVTRKGDPTELG